MTDLADIPRNDAWTVLAFAGETADVLERATDAALRRLAAGDVADFAAVAARLRAELRPGPHRRALVCSGPADAVDALQRRPPGRLVDGVAHGPASLAWLLPGLGNHHVGMGRDLYAGDAAFRRSLDHSAAALRGPLGVDLRESLYAAAPAPAPAGLDLRRMLGRAPAAEGPLERTDRAQPLLFAVELALADCLQARGVRPAALLGYSLGEYVAACLAGVHDRDDALALVAARAQKIAELPPGAMLAVALPEAELLPRLTPPLERSAVQGPALCVVAGPVDAVDAFAARLAAEGVACRRLPTTHAFHTSMLAPIAAPLAELAARRPARAPAIPCISNVTGGWLDAAAATDPAYWSRHLCEPVRLSEGLATLWRDPRRVLLEVGPGQALSSAALAHPDRPAAAVAAQAMRAEYDAQSDLAVLLRALARIWAAGVELDWSRALPADPRPARADISAPVPGAMSAGSAAPVPGDISTMPASAPPAGDERAHVPQDRSTIPAAPVPGDRPAATGEDLVAAVGELFAALLRRGACGPGDNFFELGGNSLLAAQLSFRVRRRFRVDVSLREILAAPTVFALARAIAARRGETLAAAPAAPAPAPAPEGPPRATLPNGLEVVYQSRVELDHFYSDIFDHRVYARNGVRIAPGAVVFDVGANVGLFTVFAGLAAADVQVYAFEPAPAVFALLRRNAAAHNPRARLFNCGISDVARDAELTFYPRSSGMSTFHPDLAEEREALRAIIANQRRQGDAHLDEVTAHLDDLLDHRFAHERVVCRLRTLSDVLAETGVARVDLLKIDVQKCELEVLLGLADADWPKIAQIVIEVHDIEGRVAAIERLLRGRGFARVAVEQDALYAGSPIYNLYALRDAGPDVTEQA